VWVPVVHLTSNRKGSDLYNKRHLQLQVIFAKICPAAEPGKHFPLPLPHSDVAGYHANHIHLVTRCFCV
jgi:hypothetical protein